LVSCVCAILSSPPPAPPRTYTLSLHDALPISAEADLTDLVLESFSKASALAPRRWIIDSTPEAFGVVDEQRLTQALLAASCSSRSEEHTSELQSRFDLVCRLLLEKKKRKRLRI